MKASKQVLGAAAMLALAAGPAAADSASTTMSVSVQVVAPGSLGVVVGTGQAGQDNLGEPVGTVHTAAPSPQGSAVPSVESGAAGDEALQPK